MREFTLFRVLLLREFTVFGKFALLFIIMIIAYLPLDVNFLDPKSDDLASQGNKISLNLLGYCAYLRCLLTLQNPAERLLKLLVAKIKCNVFRQ